MEMKVYHTKATLFRFWFLFILGFFFLNLLVGNMSFTKLHITIECIFFTMLMKCIHILEGVIKLLIYIYYLDMVTKEMRVRDVIIN